MERADYIAVAQYDVLRAIAGKLGVTDEFPEIEPLGSGWMEDILDIEEQRQQRIPELRKLTAEEALRYSLLSPD